MMPVFSFTDPYTDPTPHLLAALVAPETDVRLIAAQTIRKLPSSQAVPVLIARLQAETSDEVLAEVVETLGILRARDAVIPLLALVAHPDELVRANLAESLGWIGTRSPKVNETLLTLLTDPDEVVRCYAAESLGDTGFGAEALAALQKRGETDASPMVRVWCVYGRVGLGDEWDWDTLGEAFADGEAIVRRQAFLAVRMMVTDETAEAASTLIRAAQVNETSEDLRGEYEAFLRSVGSGERFP
ncbi:MAG: HEAT repeat domain-containing protein [Armatimonadetes bacterium]|nr:HEAT repeat domain-containing protein [Armatimonadota bacterium]